MGYDLTRDQAKRFILLKQGLLGDHQYEGGAGILDYVSRVGCVQYDPIDICGKNSELVMLSRVKNVKKSDLYSLLYKERTLIDHYEKQLSIVRTEDWPYLSRYRQSYTEHVRSQKEIAGVSDEIRRFIVEHGPICSGDLEYDQRVDWYWSNTRLSRAALEAMLYCGELIVHHKKGSGKYYDLAENHIPEQLLNSKDPNIPEDSFHEWQLLRRIGAVGLMWNRTSDAFLNIPGFRAVRRERAFSALQQKGLICELCVEDIKFPLFCKTEDLPLAGSCERPKENKTRTEFIAPLDGFLWDRKLIYALFDFDYKWEIYTPKEQRKYGYYTLPILHGENLIGRIEPVADRKSKTLNIKGLWLEHGVKPAGRILSGIQNAVNRLAEFNRCKSTESINLYFSKNCNKQLCLKT